MGNVKLGNQPSSTLNVEPQPPGNAYQPPLTTRPKATGPKGDGRGTDSDAFERPPNQLSTGDRDAGLPSTENSTPVSGDRARFSQLADAINDATRSKVNIGHAFGFLFDVAALGTTGGVFTGAGIRALPGHVIPREAQALADQFAAGSSEDRRMLAVGLEGILANNEFEFHTRENEDGATRDSRAMLQALVDSVPPSSITSADRAMGNLLSEVIQVRVGIDATHAPVASAARDGESARSDQIKVTDASLDRLELSMKRVPAELRTAAKNNLQDAFQDHNWPDNLQAYPTLVRLLSILSDNSDQRDVIRNVR